MALTTKEMLARNKKRNPIRQPGEEVKKIKTKKDGFKTIPEKNAKTMSEIARKKSNPTMSEKFAGTMKKISDDSKMAKPMAKPDSVKKKAKKAPIVTEKMLKDSGYTNLRDYMNAKSGKTRKDGKTASRTAAAKKKDMMSGSFKAGGSVKKMMGGGMTKIKYRGGGIVKQGVRPTRYI